MATRDLSQLATFEQIDSSEAGKIILFHIDRVNPYAINVSGYEEAQIF